MLVDMLACWEIEHDRWSLLVTPFYLSKNEIKVDAEDHKNMQVVAIPK